MNASETERMELIELYVDAALTELYDANFDDAKENLREALTLIRE